MTQSIETRTADHCEASQLLTEAVQGVFALVFAGFGFW